MTKRKRTVSFYKKVSVKIKPKIQFGNRPLRRKNKKKKKLAGYYCANGKMTKLYEDHWSSK